MCFNHFALSQVLYWQDALDCVYLQGELVMKILVCDDCNSP